MLAKKQFVKKTKKGQVLKVVREHYLRDDISSGTPLDPESDPGENKLSATARHYLVVDTNVVLDQMDLLEHAAIEDVILPAIVLEEANHRNTAVYQRLRLLTGSRERRFFVFSNEHHRETYVTREEGESANDRNDRAIRVAAAWYAARLPTMPVLLLSNDRENRQKALALGVEAVSIQQYAASRTDAPELQDLVAGGLGGGDVEMEDAERADGGKVRRGAKRQRVYAEHWPSSKVTAGLSSGQLHQGTLRVNRRNPFEGRIASEGGGADILLRGRPAMNRALDGDRVAVELLPEAQWGGGDSVLAERGEEAEEGEEEGGPELEGGGLAQEVGAEEAEPPGGSRSAKRPCGQVVGILKRNWRVRGYAGSLKPPKEGQAVRRGPGSVLFCPLDPCYPFIRIQTRNAETLADKRLVVAIDCWEADSLYPAGHYVRSLGKTGEKATETEALILEHDIITAPFSPAVHACVPPLPWSVTDADRADPHREDLRHLAVCSVDPPGCKDIDDALHVAPLPGGGWQLGVHIADVTHFLRPGTAMDAEAALRGTTTYLVDRRIDMLPKPLTEDICSLRAGVERLAFSVLWEVDAEAHITAVRFTKSLIRSRAALTYQEAQAMIDDPGVQSEVAAALRAMNGLAKRLRARRQERGALQLASPEVKFSIDTETQNPLDIGMYQVRETNQMVEEMMLLANVTVAEAVLRQFPGCTLLRRHEAPAPERFEPLLRAAAACGVDVAVASSKALAESLDGAARAEDPYFNTLIRILATRCMTQAQYFGSGSCPPDEYLHYGLAAPLYTHFTSPIRRYADVVVHRLLAATLRIDPLPDSAQDNATLKALCENLNTRHHNAQLAGRASVELHTLLFFSARPPEVADARVTKVQKNGLVIFVPKYGIEGPVYVTKKGAAEAAQWVLDEEGQALRGPDGTVRRIFDKAAVRITVVVKPTGQRRQVLLELVDRSQLAAGSAL